MFWLDVRAWVLQGSLETAQLSTRPLRALRAAPARRAAALKALRPRERGPLEREDVASRHREIVAGYSGTLAELVVEARAISEEVGSKERLELREQVLQKLRAPGYVDWRRAGGSRNEAIWGTIVV